MKKDNNYYINLVIEMSKKAFYPYAAVVVKDGEIIGRSDNDKKLVNTAFQHCELVAINDATNNLYGGLEGATLYTSCEPCAMCMGAILYTKIKKLVYAANLKDSNDNVVEEILCKAQDVANICSNRNIEIVPDVQRSKAVAVLKEWKNNITKLKSRK